MQPQECNSVAQPVWWELIKVFWHLLYISNRAHLHVLNSSSAWHQKHPMCLTVPLYIYLPSTLSWTVPTYIGMIHLQLETLLPPFSHNFINLCLTPKVWCIEILWDYVKLKFLKVTWILTAAACRILCDYYYLRESLRPKLGIIIE